MEKEEHVSAFHSIVMRFIKKKTKKNQIPFRTENK